uniref:Sulfatase N-terminal domain-containing protein n=1 Tax=Magnetococcus massalia (strain MO-1) TaxID=451514 RepID=A0A1S7LFC1_MAGMO|nr:membrane protein of unknown function[Include Sulfatase domain] [Candidatus Magnetococcus massalia]
MADGHSRSWSALLRWLLSYRMVPLVALVYLLAFYGQDLTTLTGHWEELAWLQSRWQLALSGALLLLAILALFRPLFIVALPLLFLTTAFSAFFVDNYNIPLTTNMVGALFESNRTEAISFITPPLLAYLAFHLLLGGGLAWLYHRHIPAIGLHGGLRLLGVLLITLLLWRVGNWSTDTIPLLELPELMADSLWLPLLLLAVVVMGYQGKQRLLYSAITLLVLIKLLFLSQENAEWLVIFALGVVGGWLLLPPLQPGELAHRMLIWLLLLLPGATQVESLEGHFPFSYPLVVADYLEERREIQSLRKQRVNLAELPSALDAARAEGLTIILILGESARRENWSLNGYERLTNPLLAKRKNLINYTQAETCASLTRVALPCLLTRATTEEPSLALRESSLYPLFAKHGFHTVWLSINDRYGNLDELIANLADDTEEQFFRNHLKENRNSVYDGYLLPRLDQLLAKYQDQKLFVTLHTYGSHWMYDDRYPARFRQFKPVCPGHTAPPNCDPDNLLNAYDNTILYTDWLIDQVMERVSDRKALVIYVSDHGESLGEDGFYSHSYPSDRDEQWEIPMMIWGSESYIANNPQGYAAMAQMAHEPTSHDHLFHTLLDCSGISGEMVEPGWSLCRSQPNAAEWHQGPE